MNNNPKQSKKSAAPVQPLQQLAPALMQNDAAAAIAQANWGFNILAQGAAAAPVPPPPAHAPGLHFAYADAGGVIPFEALGFEDGDLVEFAAMQQNKGPKGP